MVSKDDFDDFARSANNDAVITKEHREEQILINIQTNIGKVLCDIRDENKRIADELEQFNKNYRIVHRVQIKNHYLKVAKGER